MSESYPDWAESFGGVAVATTFYRCVHCGRRKTVAGRFAPGHMLCLPCWLDAL